MKACFPCVGLVVFAGCFLLVMGPDETPQSALPASPSSATRMVVVIDPGHGGLDDGTRGLQGLVEKDVALDISNRLDGVLHNHGIPTLMTRTNDRYVALSERVAMADKTGPHVLVSIHLNSKHGSGANGFEIYYADNKEPAASQWLRAGLFPAEAPQPDPDGRFFADTVRQALDPRVATLDRGVRPGHLYVLRHTSGPAILIEAGFIDSPIDAGLLSDNAHRQALATAIANGVMRFMEERSSGARDSIFVKR
jgi:N-acetylmuramoyl-L-alanine amidase